MRLVIYPALIISIILTIIAAILAVAMPIVCQYLGLEYSKWKYVCIFITLVTWYAGIIVGIFSNTQYVIRIYGIPGLTH